MRAMLAGLGSDGMARAAIGAGAFAMLLLGLANVDAGVLWGLLGLALAGMASAVEVAPLPHEDPLEEETHWYEYDGTFRGMVG